MRPQTIGLFVASAVTALFMAAVGVVALWHYMPEREPQAPRQHLFFGQVNQGVAIAPMPGVDFPAEQNAIPEAELPNARGAAVPAEKYELSGPHAHGNLAIFLIHGDDTLKDQKILTLQEGLEQGQVVVRDQGQLFIDNRANMPLFIQAGDIVKGGSQDRTLPFDMLVAANTNNTQVPAFCVEAGRSGPRGNEVSASFSTSTEQLPGRKFRLATMNGLNAQGQVWNNVAALQTNLARNVGGPVQAQQSQTSLQLTLEHPRVQTAVQKYVAELGQLPAGKQAIGYVVVINGKIQSADVYASSALFEKVWPKLLKAGAVEALAERQPGAVPAAPTADAVETFLRSTDKAQAFRVQNGNRGVVIRQETADVYRHDTCDPARDHVVLHRSYLAK